MRMIRVVAIGAIFFISSFVFQLASAADQAFQGSEVTAENLIRNTLRQFLEKLESEKDPKGAEKIIEILRGLGFQSPDELANATVDSSVRFRIFVVGLNALRNLQKEGTFELTETNGFIYPIMVLDKNNMQLRSSATVVIDPNEKSKDRGLRLTQLGSPALVRLLLQAKNHLLDERKTKACECFLVSVPALSRHFLGDKTGGNFMMRVLQDGPGKLKKGQLLTAEKVFAELSDEAKKNQYDMPRRPRADALEP